MVTKFQNVGMLGYLKVSAILYRSLKMYKTYYYYQLCGPKLFCGRWRGVK